MELESVVAGYILGSESNRDTRTNNTVGSVPLGLVFLLLINIVILYFFGDMVFDILGLSFFLQDMDNSSPLAGAIEFQNTLMTNTLPLIPISIGTGMVFTIFQYIKRVVSNG